MKYVWIVRKDLMTWAFTSSAAAYNKVIDLIKYYYEKDEICNKLINEVYKSYMESSYYFGTDNITVEGVLIEDLI